MIPLSQSSSALGSARAKMASHTGLQDGYSTTQWGPWKSHSLLLQTAISELGWSAQAQRAIRVFKAYSHSRAGFLNRDEFTQLNEQYRCCGQQYVPVFFDLFDRNQDGFLNESDFLGGMLAVSPHAPHQLDSAMAQLRMQFIFLYYDSNRNGKFEVDEIAKIQEHLQQLAGQPTDGAEREAIALMSRYGEPFGFAFFFDAAQKGILNGTEKLLRTSRDITEVIQETEAVQAQVTQWGGYGRPQAAGHRAGVVHGNPSVIDAPGAGTFAEKARQDANRMQRSDPHSFYSSSAKSTELRVVRRLMELSNNPAMSWVAPLDLVSAEELYALCDSVVAHLRHEDSLVDVPLPCRVYGDIHGQLPDLLQFFNAFSWPDKRRGDIFSMNYIFLGDFVDRGAFSVDVVTLLFSLKILYPKKVFLVRGNHEDRLMNVNYGFHADCVAKFGQLEGERLWERMNDVFEFLPIAAHVGKVILCIHGGIGDSISSLGDLRNIPKPIQVAAELDAQTTKSERVVLDALWSDPTDNDHVLGVHDSPRGQNTCRFGPDRVLEFNKKNNIKLIIRAHECVQAGYEYFAGGQLLTVFSATNYCNQYQNDGAMVVLVHDEVTGEVVEHAQVIRSGQTDTSSGWNTSQFRAPSPMRRAPEAGYEAGGADPRFAFRP